MVGFVADGPEATHRVKALRDNVSPELLPFSFARRFGVVITGDAPEIDGRIVLACIRIPSLSTLAEIKRFAHRDLKLRIVTESEFEDLLANAYARDASEAKQMVEDIGDEFDLASLVKSWSLKIFRYPSICSWISAA